MKSAAEMFVADFLARLDLNHDGTVHDEEAPLSIQRYFFGGLITTTIVRSIAMNYGSPRCKSETRAAELVMIAASKWRPRAVDCSRGC